MNNRYHDYCQDINYSRLSIKLINYSALYWHAGRYRTLISSSSLQGGNTGMLAGATLSALTACCSISTLLRRECDSMGSYLEYLPCYKVTLIRPLIENSLKGQKCPSLQILYSTQASVIKNGLHV